MSAASTALLAAGVSPDNEEARRWLEDELSKPKYQENEPGFVERILNSISDWFGRLMAGIDNASSPIPLWIIAVIVGAAIIGAIVALRYVRRTPRAPETSADAVLGGRAQTADEFRELAEAALRAGDPDAAVRNALRAIARRGHERTLLVNAPSMTAHEIARNLARHFEHRRDELSSAADLFDAIEYGGRHARTDQAQSVIDLERHLASATPAPAESAARSEGVPA